MNYRPDIVRDNMAGRYVDFDVQHLKQSLELGVIHNCEWPVMVHTPHGDEKSDARGRVDGACSIRGDHLLLRGLLGLAEQAVAGQVPCRVLVVLAVDCLEGMTRSEGH